MSPLHLCTVRHQVRLKEPNSRILPVRKSPQGNLVFEQLACLAIRLACLVWTSPPTADVPVMLKQRHHGRGAWRRCNGQGRLNGLSADRRWCRHCGLIQQSHSVFRSYPVVGLSWTDSLSITRSSLKLQFLPRLLRRHAVGSITRGPLPAQGVIYRDAMRRFLNRSWRGSTGDTAASESGSRNAHIFDKQ